MLSMPILGLKNIWENDLNSRFSYLLVLELLISVAAVSKLNNELPRSWASTDPQSESWTKYSLCFVSSFPGQYELSLSRSSTRPRHQCNPSESRRQWQLDLLMLTVLTTGPEEVNSHVFHIAVFIFLTDLYFLWEQYHRCISPRSP